MKTLSENTVYITKVDEKRLEKTVEQSLKPFHIPHLKTVFIKPNLCDSASPKSGIVTNVHVIEALIKVLRRKGVKKIVVGDGVSAALNIQEIFRKSRFNELVEKCGVELVNLEKVERVRVSWHYGSILLPKIIFESFYVNVPVIKTHIQTLITISLKNQKGILLSTDKKLFHKWGLHEPIAHLAKVAKPDLVFVDGTYGMEGDGPTSGKTRKIGIFVAGRNMVSVDSVCSRIMGIAPSEVKHIVHAEQIGVGKINCNVICNFDYEKLASPFEKPKEKLLQIGHVRFWRSPTACSQCTLSLKHALTEVRSHPYKYPKKWIFLFYHTLLGRIDFLYGADAKVPNPHGHVIAIGNCTKRLACQKEVLWIKGCPPSPKEIIENI